MDSPLQQQTKISIKSADTSEYLQWDIATTDSIVFM